MRSGDATDNAKYRRTGTSPFRSRKWEIAGTSCHSLDGPLQSRENGRVCPQRSLLRNVPKCGAMMQSLQPVNAQTPFLAYVIGTLIVMIVTIAIVLVIAPMKLYAIRRDRELLRQR